MYMLKRIAIVFLTPLPKIILIIMIKYYFKFLNLKIVSSKSKKTTFIVDSAVAISRKEGYLLLNFKTMLFGFSSFFKLDASYSYDK